jgi:Protein of unknown function (DUF4012)
MTRGRQVKIAATLIFLALAASIFWIMRTGAEARRQLVLAKYHLEMVDVHRVSKEPARIARVISTVNRQVQQANDLTHDPIWWAASHVPYIGRTPTAVRTTVASLSDILNAVAQSDDLLTSYQRHPGHVVDRRLLKIAGAVLTDVKQPARIAVHQLQALNLSGVPDVIADPVIQVRDQFATAQPYVEQGKTFLKVAPLLLGLNGPKTWLLVMNNGAEARATGGIPGGWATLSAKDGHLELTHLETNSAISARTLRNWQSLVPQDMQNLYGVDLAHLADMNLSPDYPTNARLMNALYQQHTGGNVDGVISIDEYTLAGLMAVTGSVQIGSRHLRAGTVVDYVTKGVYADYPNPKLKDEAVMEITRRVFKHLSQSNVHEVDLARAFIPSIYRGRLHVWSTNSQDQLLLSTTLLSGSMSNPAQPTHMAVVINAAGNKIDAYVASTITYEQGKCRPDVPYRASTIEVSLRNDAPRSGLPAYVTPRNDRGYRDNSDPGSTMSAAFIHVPLGSEFSTASVNGKRVQMVQMGSDHNRDVWEFHVELGPKATKTMKIQFIEPISSQSQRPSLGVQPMAIPMKTRVHLGPKCDVGPFNTWQSSP